MGPMPPRAETRRRGAAGLRQRVIGALCVTVLAGCGAGLSSASEAADRVATEASTTRADSSPDRSNGATTTSEGPGANDDGTADDGSTDDGALGIGDDYFPDSGNPGDDVASYDLALDMKDDPGRFEAGTTSDRRRAEHAAARGRGLDGQAGAAANARGARG